MPMDPQDFKHLLEDLTYLQEVVLTCDFDKAQVEELGTVLRRNITLKKLKIHILDYRQWSSSDNKKIFSDALGNHSLEELSIYCEGGPFGHHDTTALSAGLKNNSSLKRLTLSTRGEGTRIVMQPLVEPLKQSTSLKSLNISFSNWSPPGNVQEVKYFAEIIETNTSLIEVRLTDTKIDSIGTQILTLALVKNTTLKILYLTNVNMGPHGAICLAETMRAHPSIAELYLERNSISLSGVRALAKALITNRVLRVLSLSDSIDQSPSGPAGAKLLLEALQDNLSLQELSACTDDAIVSVPIENCLERNRRSYLAGQINFSIQNQDEAKNDDEAAHIQRNSNNPCLVPSDIAFLEERIAQQAKELQQLKGNMLNLQQQNQQLRDEVASTNQKLHEQDKELSELRINRANQPLLNSSINNSNSGITFAYQQHSSVPLRQNVPSNAEEDSQDQAPVKRDVCTIL